MKKFGLIVCCFMLITITSYAQDRNLVREVGDTDVQIRSAPGNEADVLLMIPKETKVRVLQKRKVKQGLFIHSWYKIKFKGKVGWISGLVFKTPDELLLDIPEDEKISGELRPLVQAQIGKDNYVIDLIKNGTVFVVNYELKSFRNKNIDRTNVKNLADKVMKVFIDKNVENFDAIEINTTTKLDGNEDVISKIVITYDEVQRCKADPYTQKVFESFEFNESFYDQ